MFYVLLELVLIKGVEQSDPVMLVLKFILPRQVKISKISDSKLKKGNIYHLQSLTLQ